MESLTRTLRLLLGKPERKTRFLQGREKAIVDASLALTAAGKNARYFFENRTPLLEIVNALDSQASIASGFRHGKYVYYDGFVYLDCFAPRWPGAVLESGMENLVRNLGRESGEWEPFLPSVVISLTKKCVYRCEHCYAVRTLGDRDVITAAQWLRLARDFQKIGVGVMAWEGGEPLLRFEDLLMLLRETRDRSDQLVATTAYGLTEEKARRLKEAGLNTAIISLDHYLPDKHNRFRGNKKAFDMAVNGVRIFRENGILPSIAVCVGKELLAQDGLFRYLELGREIGAAFIQVLDATPSGNYLGKDVMLTASQLEEIRAFQRTVNSDARYRDYPGIQARAFLEDEDLYGCSAATALVYVDSSGNVQPCDLLQISFGNLLEESVETVFRRMKRCLPHSTKGRCPAQTFHKQIANVSRETGELPVRWNDAEPILQSMISRGLPDHFDAIRKKRERKRFRDLLPVRKSSVPARTRP